MRGRVAFLRVAAVIEGGHPRRPGTHHGPGRHQVVRPPAAHQRLRLGGAGIAADQRRAAQLVRAQHRHLAGMRIRRPRLGEAVIAVVPHHHQTQIGDGGEHRAAGPDDQPRAAAQHGQPSAVPLCRAQPGRQRHHPRLVDVANAGVAKRIHVALVGHDGQHAATGVHRHRRGLGEPVGPPLPRQRLPHRAGRAPVAQGGQKLFAAAVFVPGGGVDRCRGERREFRGGFPLDVGVPRRDGQPQHVGPGAGIPCGDRVDQAAHLGRQHRLGGDHPVQPAQLADMVGVRTPFEHERIDEPAVEAHPYPHAGLCVVGLLGRDEIVELAIQMRHRQHGQHPGDGFVLGAAGSRSRGCVSYRCPRARRRSASSNVMSLADLAPRDRLREL